MAVNMAKHDYKIAWRLRHCFHLWQPNFNSAKFCFTENKVQCGLAPTAIRGRQTYVTRSMPHLHVSIYNIFAHYAQC